MGFVVFDNYLFMHDGSDERKAIMMLICDGKISFENLMYIVQNSMGAGPLFGDDKFLLDWQSKASNEFNLRKLATAIVS